MKKTRKWKKWCIIVLILIAALLIIRYLSTPKQEIQYLTENVTKTNIEEVVNATGEISAIQLINVGAQASGQVKKMYVDVGQDVKKGDLIAEIDSTTQVNTLNAEKAKLENFKAQLVSSEVAYKIAQTKLNREKALWQENATSKANLEDAENNFAAAKASIAQIQSSIKQTQISINTSQADIGYTKIVAPIDGKIVSLVVEEGQTVNANQNTPTIVQIADLSQMLNKMQISEGDANKVKAGMKVTFNTLSEPDNKRESTLSSVDPGLTTMSRGAYSNSTDTSSAAIYYFARTIVDNEDLSLRIGMTTENAIIVNSAQNVLTVPILAIKKQQGKQFVRVLKSDNTVVEKEVSTGLNDTIKVEIKSGLSEGESVILSEVNPDETADLPDGPPNSRR